MRFVILAVFFLMFSHIDSYAQKKTEFEYPENAVADSSKKTFIKNFNQGKVLYTITCAQCHNVKEGRKELIPDFSLPQLMDYEMRISYPSHTDRLTDTKLTDDELNKIIIFLRYKKKSGIPIHG